MSVPKQAVAALVATVAALSLTGCGTAGPGVAAKVGDQTVSVSDVDRLTDGYCKAFAPGFTAQQQTYPLRYVRSYVVGTLTLRAAAEQFAADNDISVPDGYVEQVKQLETDAEAFPASHRDELVEVESGRTYVAALERQIGGQLLLDEGTPDGTDDDKQSRGRDAFVVWLAEHDVDVNPRYGVQITNGDFTDVDTNTSYALSADAVAAAKTPPDQAYAATLPSSQRCG